MKDKYTLAKLLIDFKHKKFKERKPYHYGEEMALSDMYSIHKELYGCTIWKTTNIGENPEFKGEPLCTYIPFWENYDFNGLVKLLDNLYWHYI